MCLPISCFIFSLKSIFSNIMFFSSFQPWIPFELFQDSFLGVSSSSFFYLSSRFRWNVWFFLFISYCCFSCVIFSGVIFLFIILMLFWLKLWFLSTGLFFGCIEIIGAAKNPSLSLMFLWWLLLISDMNFQELDYIIMILIFFFNFEFFLNETLSFFLFKLSEFT